jgi:hypothetical protein
MMILSAPQATVHSQDEAAKMSVAWATWDERLVMT